MCCVNESVKCNQPPFLPEELNGIMDMNEYNQLCDEVNRSICEAIMLKICSKLNKVFSDTVLPMVPCMLTHFCLPFSPVCARLYYQGKRREGVRQVLVSFNERYLIERGAYL